MNPQHRPHGPQVAADGSTAPDPIGDQGAVPEGAQRSSEGREAISLRDQIAAALMPPSGAFVMAGIEAQADAVMAVVQPALDAKDTEIERLTEERDLARKSRDEHANRLEVAERMRPADYYQQLDEIRGNIADERVAHAAREHALASAEAERDEAVKACDQARTVHAALGHDHLGENLSCAMCKALDRQDRP